MQRESTGATKPTPFAKTQLDHTPAHARPALYRSAMIVLVSIFFLLISLFKRSMFPSLNNVELLNYGCR